MKILVVDDDQAVRKLIVTALSYCVNRDVPSFGSPNQALSYIQECEDIDIVISDIDMPDMDGFDFMTTVKEMYPQITFILMSGVIDYEERSCREGASAFLAKPFEIKDLFNIVQYFVVEKPSV